MFRLLAPCFESYAGQREEQETLRKALATYQIDYIPWHAVAGELPECDGVFWQAASKYYQYLPEFEALLAEVEARGLPSLNSTSLVRWNADKRYLRELEQQGISLIPTLWQAQLEVAAARSWAESEGYGELVVKPTLSAGAFCTYRLAADDAALWAQIEKEYRGVEGVMIQPFLPEILEEGEWSFLFYDRQLSHAVLKTAKAGDYRIQHTHGGAFRTMEPPCALLAQAQAILAALPEPPDYARVDAVRRGEKLLLMEVELIEPYFYLSAAPGQAEVFARQIVQKLGCSKKKVA